MKSEELISKYKALVAEIHQHSKYSCLISPVSSNDSSRLPSPKEISAELNSATDSRKLELLYELMKNDQTSLVSMNRFIQALMHTGLRRTDPRLKQFFAKLTAHSHSSVSAEDNDEMLLSEGVYLNREQFIDCIQENCELICQALEGEFIIPEWQRFTRVIDDMFKVCRSNTTGKVANYIPQLARFDPNYWAVSICTVDGQRYSVGDSKVPFCLQSASKPLNYAIALNDLRPDEVHSHVGQEPSGRSFNELSLDYRRKPHNPMINAGAIAICSLLKTEWSMSDRFDYVFNEYRKLAGGEYIGFSNATFLSERDTADRNFALGYYMQENKVFPPQAKLQDTLDLYFQFCSVDVTAESCAVIAATLANGGFCPLTGERVLNPEAVRNTLSLMHSCGMYDYSGQFAFKVGLPAKSGVSGCIMLVVPNVMGICTWAPPLDSLGNSCRGIQFCEDLVKVFNFHNYDNLRHTQAKIDPCRREMQSQSNQVVALLFSAANGDVSALRRFYLQGLDVSMSDYDGRTALHLGAAEGHLEVVKFLLEKCHCNPTPRDRWGFCPLDDAERFSRKDVIEYLQSFGRPGGAQPTTPLVPIDKTKVVPAGESKMSMEHRIDTPQ